MIIISEYGKTSRKIFKRVEFEFMDMENCVPYNFLYRSNMGYVEFVPKTIHTQDSSYPRQFVLRITRTQANPCPWQLVPRQLVPRQVDNWYGSTRTTNKQFIPWKVWVREWMNDVFWLHLFDYKVMYFILMGPELCGYVY